MSIFDRLISGGGGPTTGQTRQQVLDLIAQQVAAPARTGNATAWPANKITLPNTDSITEGSTNMYFTTERALAAAEIPLTLGAVTGSAQHSTLRTATETGGDPIDIPSGVEHGAADGGFLLELNGFYAQVLFSDITALPVAATNDTAADTSGNSQNAILFQQPDLGNGVARIYVGHTAADKLLLAGSNDDGTTRTDETSKIKIYPLDHARHGTFNRSDPAETTIADDDYLVFFDTSESFSPPKRITGANLKTYLGSQSGGNQPTQITATVLEGLIDDTQGNVDATLTTDSSKVILTATVQGGGGGTFTLSNANLYPILNTTLLTDSTITKTLSTTNNTITLGVTPGTTPPTPAAHEMLYAGKQNSNSFASWSQGDEENSYDVQTSGTTVTVDITNIPNTHWVYMLFPDDRSPTSVVGSLGAEVLNSFTVDTGAVTIGSTSYDAYTIQNNSGDNVPSLRYIVTVE